MKKKLLLALLIVLALTTLGSCKMITITGPADLVGTTWVHKEMLGMITYTIYFKSETKVIYSEGSPLSSTPGDEHVCVILPDGLSGTIVGKGDFTIYDGRKLRINAWEYTLK